MRKNFAEFDYQPSDTVYIGNDVWIGDGVFIKPGVHIGDGAIIGAHSVVVHDVDPFSVIAGVPAREIRKRYDNEIIDGLQSIQWWNWSDEKIQKYSKYFSNPRILLDNVSRGQ